MQRAFSKWHVGALHIFWVFFLLHGSKSQSICLRMIKKLGQKTSNCFNIITMIDLFTQAIPISENWFRVTIRQTYVTMRSTTNVYQAVQRAQWSPSLILAYYLISPMVWRSVVTPYQWEVVRHPASSFVLLLVYIWDALLMTCSYIEEEINIQRTVWLYRMNKTGLQNIIICDRTW